MQFHKLHNLFDLLKETITSSLEMNIRDFTVIQRLKTPKDYAHFLKRNVNPTKNCWPFHMSLMMK